MVVVASDLTGLARIRNAALEGFARDGAAGTSLRDVAKAAGVSPGLPEPFMTAGQLERWNVAGNALFSEVLYRRPPRRARVSESFDVVSGSPLAAR
jgi:hypothetical protein